MEFKYFNLNKNFKIKFTDLGYEKLAEKHNSYAKYIPNWELRSAEYYKEKADTEGYLTMQGHTFLDFCHVLPEFDYTRYFSLNIMIQQ